jgi:Spy/CpxP family protein refolding chaperone
MMKSLAYGIALFTVFTGVATAQPPEPGERMDRMAILLDLDDYQKGEVQRIFDEQRAARQARRDAIRESGVRPSREERDAQRQQARDNMRLQLQGVLTPEQMTKFDVLAEDRQGRGRRGRGGGGPRGDDAAE